MDEQLAKEKKELQIREKKLEQEKTWLEGLERDLINALTAEVASQAEEIERLNRQANTYVNQLRKQLADKDKQIKRG